MSTSSQPASDGDRMTFWSESVNYASEAKMTDGAERLCIPASKSAVPNRKGCLNQLLIVCRVLLRVLSLKLNRWRIVVYYLPLGKFAKRISVLAEVTNHHQSWVVQEDQPCSGANYYYYYYYYYYYFYYYYYYYSCNNNKNTLKIERKSNASGKNKMFSVFCRCSILRTLSLVINIIIVITIITTTIGVNRWVCKMLWYFWVLETADLSAACSTFVAVVGRCDCA